MTFIFQRDFFEFTERGMGPSTVSIRLGCKAVIWRSQMGKFLGKCSASSLKLPAA